MAAHRKRTMRRRKCAPRPRRLLLEQFESRQMLSTAPSGADKSVSILEGASHTFTAANFGFMTISAGAFGDGPLEFDPANNVFGNPNPAANFSFQVKDNGGGTAVGGIDTDQSPNTITFDVTPVNDPPSFLPITVQPFSDESGLISVATTQTSLGPPDEAAQQVTQYFVVGVSNPGLFLTPPAFDAVGNLTFKPMPNTKGTAQITIGLKDDGGTASGGVDTNASQTLTIEVFKDRQWHNVAKPLDVTGNGSIDSGDALDVINFLNAFRSQRVPDDGRAEGPYYDCDGDGFVTAADALDVINYLNAFRPDAQLLVPGGEAASMEAPGGHVQPFNAIVATASTQNPQRLSLDELITLLGLDVALQSKRREEFSKNP